MMQGMFKANGGCGYVKKPNLLLTTFPNNGVFDPKAKLPVKTTLKVSSSFSFLRKIHLTPTLITALRCYKTNLNSLEKSQTISTLNETESSHFQFSLMNQEYFVTFNVLKLKIVINCFSEFCLGDCIYGGRMVL